MTWFEIIVIVLLLVNSGLLWFNFRNNEDKIYYLRKMNENIYEIKEKVCYNWYKWVIFVVNVNTHLRLYGDVNMVIIKDGCLFVITVLQI